MDKSTFYKAWLTRHPGHELNEYGYPPTLWLAQPITTEEQWQAFLVMQPDVEVITALDGTAAQLAGVSFVRPYTIARSADYPILNDQLDAIYKALMAIKTATGVDYGQAADAIFNQIAEVKAKYPKTTLHPDLVKFNQSNLIPNHAVPELVSNGTPPLAGQNPNYPPIVDAISPPPIS